jgi:hypothetical protein
VICNLIVPTLKKRRFILIFRVSAFSNRITKYVLRAGRQFNNQLAPQARGKEDYEMQEAIKRYLKRSVMAYPDPMQWWAFILNATKGNFGPLLEGYQGDISLIHKQIRED